MIDLTALQELFDDEKMIRRYLVLFRSDATVTISELKQAIQNKDLNLAAIAAHSLKSQLRYLNENETSGLAQEIEKLCEGNVFDKSEILRLVDALEERLSLVIQGIDALIE